MLHISWMAPEPKPATNRSPEEEWTLIASDLDENITKLIDRTDNRGPVRARSKEPINLENSSSDLDVRPGASSLSYHFPSSAFSKPIAQVPTSLESSWDPPCLNQGHLTAKRTPSP